MTPNWKKVLIALALCFTLYHTAPSIFHYSQPLNNHVSLKQSHVIQKDWQKTLKNHDKDLIKWLHSYAKGLNIDIAKISNLNHCSKIIRIEFKKDKDLENFSNYFSQAMANVPYKEFEMSIVSKDDKTLYLDKKYHVSSDHLESVYLDPLDSKNISINQKNFIQNRLTYLAQAILKSDLIEIYAKSIKETSDSSSRKNIATQISQLLNEFSESKDLCSRFISNAEFNQSPWLKDLKNYLATDKTLLLDSKIFNSSQPLVSHINKQNDGNRIIFHTHPIISSLEADWDKNLIFMTFQTDLSKQIHKPIFKSLIQELVQNIKNLTSESLSLSEFGITCPMTLAAKTPVLLTRLDKLAQKETEDFQTALGEIFKPSSYELNAENYPSVISSKIQQLSALDQENCLIVHSPFLDREFLKGAHPQSIFIVCKQLDKLAKDQDKLLNADIKTLQKILNGFGFKLINNSQFGLDFKHDQIFELKEAFKKPFSLFQSNHRFYGPLPYAVCELGKTKDRLSLSYKNDIKKQEQLITWKNNWVASLNNHKGLQTNTIAEPIQNPLLSNLSIKIKYFFKGSAQNIIKFGLDLSGGKNILIQIEDQQGKKLTEPQAIKTAIDELYKRVNKLGVSEVSIRQEGDYISLDFPGSQNLSSKDLIDASTMYFHVVNEEFSYQNSDSYPYVFDFLSKVWQEASQKGCTDPLSIQLIAYNLLSKSDDFNISIKYLKEKGLTLADPLNSRGHSSIDQTYSKVVKIKESAPEEEALCPLMIVFQNYALEGSALKDIHVSYDPTKGNYLTFGVQNQMGALNPDRSAQDKLLDWTTLFTKRKNEHKFIATRGWRMAVVLNSEVVSAPFLESPLKDSASITGSFSQQDLLKLKSDLEAGSLSFQPKIILEQTVAPELGAQDKHTSFIAMGISVVLVTLLMTSYYRFHGFIATLALIINLLMLFAAASYLNITLSLASIAGIILTLGMAVDANVLIFERMKEEQKKGLTIKEAVQKGYSKAFSAILDSNLTTMIAAFVLLSFDSGPIRGFSLTLLIGLITSVLTALFMTKFFYFIWIEKTKHTALYFSNWFRFNSINFLSKTKVATMVTIMILLTGIISLSLNSSSIIGMDFKGGYALDLKFTQEPQNISLKTTLNKALEAKGLKSSQLHIRELETPTHVRLFLDKEVSLLKKDQISWSQFFTTTLKNSDLVIEPDCLKLLDQKMTTISGQLSESMATQAIIGLSMALGLIFIYVLVRFKWPYALAATISLIHDVILTLSFVSILALLGVPVSLDISSIAAILTIIGYSLNDTIIVFDRIREERSLNTDSPLTDIIRKSLNATLSRTILTSGTTLIVLIPMIFMGSGTLFNFSLVMTLGVIFGTLSTLFLACPLFLYFSQKQKSKSMRAN